MTVLGGYSPRGSLWTIRNNGGPGKSMLVLLQLLQWKGAKATCPLKNSRRFEPTKLVALRRAAIDFFENNENKKDTAIGEQ